MPPEDKALALLYPPLRAAPVTNRQGRHEACPAMQMASKLHDADDVANTEVAGLYTVRSSAHALTMIFDRLTDARGGVNAEMTVCLGAGSCYPGSILG